MRFIDFVGNIFCLDKHISKKGVTFLALSILFFNLIKYLLNNEPFNLYVSFNRIIWGLLVASLVYTVYHYKLLFVFIKKYFIVENKTIFITLIFEVIISISIILTAKHLPYAWVIALFWMFSGLLRIIVQFSRALFYSDINEYLTVVKIFAYSRASYCYISLIIVFKALIELKLPSSFIYFSMILSIPLLYLVINLYPYMIKHKNVKNAINLIRVVGEEKRIKINRLQKLSQFSKSYFNKMLDRLVYARFLEVRNKRVELGKIYKHIKEVD